MDNGSGKRQKIPQRKEARTHHIKSEKRRHPYSLRSFQIKPQSHRHNDHNGKLPEKRHQHLHHQRSISHPQIRRKNPGPPQRKFPQTPDTSPQPLQNSNNDPKWLPGKHHLPPFQSIKRHLVQIPQIYRRPPIFSSRQFVGIKG